MSCALASLDCRAFLGAEGALRFLGGWVGEISVSGYD